MRDRWRSVVLVAAYLLLAFTAPFNPVINTRIGIPAFLAFMTLLAFYTTLTLVTAGWPAEVDILPGTEEADAERDKLL